jgi:16S rRNA processing protein RimM
MELNVSSADWILLAHIVRPQGRRGEVLAEIHTDFPESFTHRKRLFLRRGDDLREIQLESHWLHKGRVVFKFGQVDSITDAESLRGADVVLPRAERIPLEDGAVYISDLLGARVVDVRLSDAVDAGEIIDVAPEGPGPAMLVVRTRSAKEVLIPFVRAYLVQVDLSGKRVLMNLPEGLLEAQIAPADANE